MVMETNPAPGSPGQSNPVYNRGSSRNLNGRCATGDVARMAPILLWLVMVQCLLISVVKYVMGIMLKLSFPSTQIQKDYSYQPTVSVLMPCFNEGKTVCETIESIGKCNYPNKKFEVIAQEPAK
jgi:hypothetical protein